jgi:hypothetical protein
MKRWLLLMLLVLLLAACADDEKEDGGDNGGDVSSGAVGIAQDYINARVGADVEQLRELACLDYQEDAAASATSFASVEAEARNLACTETGTEGDVTTVTCSGTFFFDYDGEDQERAFEINLLMEQQDGEWKVCGEE